jgi:hypothetical protein
MICPRCGFEGNPSADHCDAVVDGAFVTIARFAWASEAGYFSHEMGLRGNFETRILWEDQSDKIHGFWQGEYLLQVPPDWADEARAMLRGLLDDNAERPQPGHPRWVEPVDEVDPTFDPQASFGINWVPIILTLTAGSVAALGYQVWSRHGEAPAVAREESPEELAAPAEGERVFVQESPDGSRWTVRLDASGDRMILLEDADGDHRPDRRRVLHAVP